MVSIKERKIGKEKFYYLEHSFRIAGKVMTKEIYLGKHISPDIDKIKSDLISRIYKEKWFLQFEEIRKNFTKDRLSMPKSAKEDYLGSFMVKFTYDSNRIEGSRLTLRETANLLDKGIAPNKPVSDIKEAECHKKVFYSMIECKKKLSLQLVIFWHKMLFSQTNQDISGKIRKHTVLISGSRFKPPLAVELNPLLNDFFDWHSKSMTKLNPVELAALVHLKFVTIHPFADGNGRISRIMMNFVLNRFGYPMMDIQYKNRNSYYNALERSQVKKDERIFLNWFFGRYLKEYRQYLK